jgi:hypothetical protein
MEGIAAALNEMPDESPKEVMRTFAGCTADHEAVLKVLTQWTGPERDAVSVGEMVFAAYQAACTAEKAAKKKS